MVEEELGPFAKADPAVVDDDPFWSEVRRRHPDVDVVLLSPPAVGGAEPTRTLPTDVVRAVAGDEGRTWQGLAPLVAERGAAEAPTVRWAVRPGGHALVVEKAVPGLGEEGGTALLRDIAFRLGADGWRLAATTRGDRPLLRATNGLLDLEAEAGSGATVLTLATGVMPVAEEDRGVVRDEVREQVGAW